MKNEPIQWYALSPEERDKVVCEAVGLPWHTRVWCSGTHIHHYHKVSTNFQDASRVIEKLLDSQWRVMIQKAGAFYLVDIYGDGVTSQNLTACATLAESICIAALRAMGYTVETGDK